MPNHDELSGKKKWAERPSSYCRWSHLSRTRNRTPSDFAILAIFRPKRNPQYAGRRAFPLDFMGIFRLLGGKSLHSQGRACRPETQLEELRQRFLANHSFCVFSTVSHGALTLWEVDRLRQMMG
jgi:hypothetical protein